METLVGTTAYIDLTALSYNLHRVKVITPNCRVLAMIKANAYGHGLVPAAHALMDADAFGVARLEEAVSLREQSIHKSIVVMAGFTSAAELQQMVQQAVVPIVHTEEQLLILEKTSFLQPIQIWIKVDTGMHRLGFAPQAIRAVYERIQTCPQVKIIGFLTHFASADELQLPNTPQQMISFNQAVSWSNAAKSLANSAGIIAWPESHADWVRPGIMLYGVSPFTEKTGDDFNLKPVMTLTSQLIAIHEFAKGAAIGYGGRWVCPEPMRVGVVATGYGDGYPRHAKNGTPVLVGGVLCQLVGRVSMDLITVDLRPHPTAQVGENVVLWGKGLPVEKVALNADTIAYELLCNVAVPRVRRVYKTPA